RYSDFDYAKDALIRGEIGYLFIVSPDYLDTGNVRIYSTSGPFDNPPQGLIESFLIEGILTESNLEKRVKNRVKEPLNAETIRLNEDGEIEEGQDSGIIMPYAIGLLLMIALVSSSGYLVQGIVSEKENRTVEILLSSLSPSEILNGKIIGYGLIGLSQVGVWVFAAVTIISFSPLSMIFQELEPSRVMILIIPYFILGYFLFASSMACFVAPLSTMKDAQQSVGIFTILAVLPIMLQGFIINAPNSFISKALSIFPYTSPVTMIMRLSLTDVPFYEMAISLLILLVAVVIVTNFSARIFRVGILMYGKKFSIKEVLNYLSD
ncbi:MAG: ABC transporter permease, partial [Halobacteriota archaeon]|nr:ABC transporter permease [Halobacteriota archaeon]